MNFRNIEYFIAVAESGNITKAAEKMYISQQALSEQIKKLEDEVGEPFFKRKNPLVLTDAGEIFLEKSKLMMRTYTEMMEAISDISDQKRSKLIIAIPATEMPLFLPGLLTEFYEKYPNIETKIFRCEPKAAVEQADNFDLYFSTLPLGLGIENIVVKKDEYAVAVSKNLVEKVYGKIWKETERELINGKNLYALKDIPFIFLTNRENEIVLDQRIIFKEAGFDPIVAFQSDNSELNSGMCRLAIGGYVASMDYCRRRFSEENGEDRDIMLYPINTGINPVVIALSYKKRKRLSEAENCFINFTKEYLNR